MKRSSRRASRCALLASIERIEPRRLLAELVGSQLLIDTTDNDVRNNRVLVETVGDTLLVTTNRNVQRFPATDVASIVAQLGAGNDKIQIAPSVNLPTTLDGGAGNDTIVAGPNADSILGGDGNDHIRPGLGYDKVDGGLGTDEVSYAGRSSPINGSLRVRVRWNQTPTGVVYRHYTIGAVLAQNESDGLEDVETLSAGEGNDTLNVKYDVETSDDPKFVARVNGGGGDDSLRADGYYGVEWESGAVIVDGESGDDFVFLSTDTTELTVIGGDGDDTIHSDESDASPPIIDAGEGVDLYEYLTLLPVEYSMPPSLENMRTSSSHGSVKVTGNENANVIEVFGWQGSYVDGAGGNDVIEVLYPFILQANTPTLLGGTGNDSITGSVQGDSIIAGAGDDTILPGLGNDTIDAGAGYDELSYADRTTPINATLNGFRVYQLFNVLLDYTRGTVNAVGEADTFADAEIVTGGAGNDTMQVEHGGVFSGVQPAGYTLRLNGGGGDDHFIARGYWQSSYRGFNTLLDGGDGDDYVLDALGGPYLTVLGGDGNDSVEGNDSDVLPSNFDAGPGVDLFLPSFISLNYTMPSELENIRAFSDFGVRIIGNDLPNIIETSGSTGSFVDGRGGNDVIKHPYGSGNVDTFLGGDGDDTILSGDSVDSIDGGPGDDYLDGGGGADSIYGGSGTDTAVRDLNDAVVDSIEIFVGGRKVKRSRFFELESLSAIA